MFKRFFLSIIPSLYWSRVFTAAFQGFTRHQSYFVAALLTYYTLLSIVPVLAVAFGIAKGFGFENFFEKQLLERLADQQILMNKAINFAHNLLEKTQEVFLVAIGFATLLWTVLKLLGTIEEALNQIWGVQKPRSLARKVTDYFALIIVCPFFFVFSSSAALFLMTQIGKWVEISILGPINPEVSFTFNLLLSWVLFTFIYFVMPNTKVNIKYGLLAGIVGGTLYQVTQWIYITFQIGVSDMGAIYGSFAALPLFLVWVNTSWLIFLFGAEIGYYAEDESYVITEKGKQKKTNRAEMALLIMTYCIQAFDKGEPPLTLQDLSKKIKIPLRMIRKIVDELIERHLLVEVFDGNAYQPATKVDSITIQTILEAMNPSRHFSITTCSTPELLKIQKLVLELEEVGKNSKENKPLRDCID